ncbi:MarR family winged helix-turn-helix transcriptional regulator [Microbacterium sp. 10M-3C3]|jgi:DNA-binding MarR family transcriptional regulator|uniref:MarR family winged helix-turn-helix transcriptional regulator n=1 Tax=Microbacterium sp. 10M-3C3 TaxID=2483401 RepID=UPI000F638EEA|nr:MarR family winged helix-turn-helix transcriptional regulator [Microbacterium sp. 10M-3C3]
MARPVDTAAPSLVDDVSFLLARANALALAAGNAALAEHGLKARSYSVLVLSLAADAPTQRDLAEFLRLDPSQVVALVDGLETRGLVERRADPSDRRVKVVVATPAGRALAARAHVSAGEAEERAHAALSADERETLRDLLRRVAFPGADG